MSITNHIELKFNKKEGDFTLSINYMFKAIVMISGMNNNLIVSLEKYLTVRQAKYLDMLMAESLKQNIEIEQVGNGKGPSYRVFSVN